MMQTPTLPIQISGASPAPARQNGNASASAESGQFSQALSREVQRQAPPAAPAKPAAPPAKQASAEKAPAAKAPANSAKPADGKTAKADKAAAKADDAEHDAAAAAQAAASTPVVDMLALVASFNQPVQAQAADAAAHADDITVGSDSASARAVVALDTAELPADVAAPAAQVVDVKVADDAAAALAQIPTDAAADVAAQAQAMPTLQRATANAFERIATPRAEAKPEAPIKTDPVATPVKPEQAAVDAQASDAVPAAVQAPRAEPAAQSAPQAAASAVEKQSSAAEHKTEQFTLKEIQTAPAPTAAPVQQSAMAQTVAAAASDKIAARVGTPGWDNQVGQKIVWMVAGKEQSASLTLNPPDMGPMQVVLNVTNDQASVTFTAAQPEVRQALEDAMPRLREMMSESGISLGNASVNAGMPEQRQAQGDTGQGGQRGRFGNSGNHAEGNDNGSAAAAAARVVARPVRTGGLSGVDTFA